MPATAVFKNARRLIFLFSLIGPSSLFGLRWFKDLPGALSAPPHRQRIIPLPSKNGERRISIAIVRLSLSKEGKIRLDHLAKSLKRFFIVIRVETEIRFFKRLADSRFPLPVFARTSFEKAALCRGSCRRI
jgi:hypothetical protein